MNKHFLVFKIYFKLLTIWRGIQYVIKQYFQTFKMREYLLRTSIHKNGLSQTNSFRWKPNNLVVNGVVYRVCGLLAAILFSTRVEEAPLKIIDGLLKKEARRRSNQHFLFLPFRYWVNCRNITYVWACLNFSASYEAPFIPK